MSDNKIWVLARNFGYDGYGTPEFAFSTRELAVGFIESNPDRNKDFEIFELPIDAALSKAGKTG